MKGAQVQCGYLPLVDCAPLVIAKELNFAAQEGLDLTLLKQPSWSALRDHLAFGQLDFAHMLSPMPIAMSLDLGGMGCEIDALMVLSVNGTVIGVSDALSDAMQKTGWRNSFDAALATSTALFDSGVDKIRIGVPFPFSMHRMLLDLWLSQATGFSPERIEIVTVPPPKMAEAVQSGMLDMFCVGEPWGSVAVQHSNATLILPGARIWEFAPEKVLGVRRAWAQDNKEICLAMIRAIYKANKWLDQPENIPLAVEILARSQHLDLPDRAIEPALSHHIAVKLGHAPQHSQHFIAFHKSAANFPWRSQAAFIGDRLARWHGLERVRTIETARHCYRSDLYREALSSIGGELPGASEKAEGVMQIATKVASSKGEMILGPDRFFNGAVFDFSTSDLPKN